MGLHNIAVDIGGTFTDVVVQDTDNGDLWTVKTPSTPEDLASGFMHGARGGLSLAEAEASTVRRIFHGTTIATNAVIEHTPANVGLVTTEGFKYVLEIGRHDIPRRQNIYAWVKPPRPVPPNRIFEVAERLDRTGDIVTPLDEDRCREVARQLKDLDVEAVAVCFLYSYANPDHERRVAEIIREEMPEVQIALSSEVLPQFREYERTVATVLNAYVMPRVGRYLAGLESAAADNGLKAPLFIMKSNGGVTSADMAARQAIHTVLSGPVAGVMGALQVANATGSPSFISIDVGGTSADICLVRDSEPEMTVERQIGGLPLQLPMLDIVTIGAGGGSIARPMTAGGLSVGPESAGASPGPACYPNGGMQPTVTDARLVLGHLPPHLLGGDMPLDVDAAREAIRLQIAEPLGLGIDEAAAGIVEIADNNMAGAMRAVSIGRGLDPKDFALVAFGGAGPMHACALASLLGMPSVIVPPTPGVLSTYGLLFTDLRSDYVQTFVHSGSSPSVTEVSEAFARMEKQAREWLDREGVASEAGRVSRSADLRYQHQGWEITVDMPPGPVTAATLEAMVDNFHTLHERLYSYNLPEANVDLVNLRVSATGALPRHEMSRLPDANGSSPSPESTRKVMFSRSDGYVDTAIYDRGSLGSGAVVHGPAIIEQSDTTTLLTPSYAAKVDGYGNLVIVGSE
ncbi:MAG: 5-oxoprolinase [Chloroflexi bacterium]|nr:5-oxoprolinase [Chloroflexota bacterium]|tara:strand:- start:2002 stop:4059 length:2058 start_codon:yes stop_codon:yes gene_type:complete